MKYNKNSVTDAQRAYDEVVRHLCQDVVARIESGSLEREELRNSPKLRAARFWFLRKKKLLKEAASVGVTYSNEGIMSCRV